MNSKFSNKVKIAFAAFILFSLAGCSKGESNSQGNKTVSGLTSIEASEIAYAKIKGGFEDTVLYRAIPVDDKNSTNPLLDKNWYENDISGGWFFWFADAKGTDWFMVAITGKSIVYTDIGTRSFSAATMPADWPRESFKVSMKEAAAKAQSQGANLDTLTWIEYNCNYPASDYRNKPTWVLTFSEELGGSTLNYTIFVDGMNGSILGAINDKGDKFALPIDREALQKTRKENHESDLMTFFDLLSKKDYDFALFQLAYDLSPNDTSAQMWKENFQSIKSIKVISIEPYRLPEWTAEREYYKVTLDIETDEAPEKYGWDNGVNVRWMTIIPQGGGLWKIEEFSTSP
jgi:hypothetical protein